MTQDEKRIKIAEACGLEVIHDPRGPVDTRPSPYRLKRDVYYTPLAAAQRRKSWPQSMSVRVVPDYFNDLNAMQEAVSHTYKTQPPGWLSSYEETLTELCGKRQHPHWDPVFALAEDRAESFGLTLKLWEAGE